jgi:hypothetical protein
MSRAREPSRAVEFFHTLRTANPQPTSDPESEESIHVTRSGPLLEPVELFHSTESAEASGLIGVLGSRHLHRVVFDETGIRQVKRHEGVRR